MSAITGDERQPKGRPREFLNWRGARFVFCLGLAACLATVLPLGAISPANAAAVPAAHDFGRGGGPGGGGGFGRGHQGDFVTGTVLTAPSPTLTATSFTLTPLSATTTLHDRRLELHDLQRTRGDLSWSERRPRR
jgi:hypothetical protein